MSLERSPLDDVHRTAGARMVPFGGWDMPLEYPSGTIAEHLACRQDAVVFDVSHLGTVRLTGPDAFDRLQQTLSNDLGKIGPGRAQYTHLLDDGDGSVLDDIIVWWHPGDGVDVFDVMPNASNTDRVREAVGGDETTAERAVLAVQGPAARDRLAAVFPAAAEVGRFRVAHATWNGVGCTVAGTGYTGERGVEIAVPADAAAALWDADRRRRRATGRAGRARHVAAGSRPAAARSRARSGDHPAAGRSRLGGGVGQAGVPRAPGRASPSARPACDGTSWASPRRAGGRPGPAVRSSSTAMPSARSRAGTSPRCWATASPSGSSRRPSSTGPR